MITVDKKQAPKFKLHQKALEHALYVAGTLVA